MDAYRTIGTYDLVHIHWLYNFSCIAAARAALASGVPYVIQPHGSLDPHFRKKNQLVKQVCMATVGWPLLRKAAAVVFDTPEEGQLASARRGVPNGRCRRGSPLRISIPCRHEAHSAPRSPR